MTIPNIIRNPARPTIEAQLLNELKRQGITEYKLWDSVHIANRPRRTGINLAHKRIVEWALMEGLPEVCIMEGDIWFPAEDGWQYFLKNKPTEDYYDLYLGGITRGDIKDGITKRYTGQFCYFIHERFYTTFLGVNENLDIDGAMSGLGKFYVCEPFAAFCYPGYSENQQGEMCYAHLLVGREFYGFGKILSKPHSAEFSKLAQSMKPKQ